MNNLNLLPPEIKAEIDYAKKNGKLVKQLFMALAVLVLFLALFAVLFFIINSEKGVAKIEKEAALNLIANKKDISDKSNDLASRITLIGKLENNKQNWNDILKEIANNTPSSIQLVSIEAYSNSKTRSKISGVSSSDKEVVLFKNLLSNSKYFNNVDIESITEGSDPTGVNRPTKVFAITLSLNPVGGTK